MTESTKRAVPCFYSNLEQTQCYRHQRYSSLDGRYPPTAIPTMLKLYVRFHSVQTLGIRRYAAFKLVLVPMRSQRPPRINAPTGNVRKHDGVRALQTLMLAFISMDSTEESNRNVKVRERRRSHGQCCRRSAHARTHYQS